jgi:hypothetical protein
MKKCPIDRHLLWNRKVHYRVKKIASLDPPDKSNPNPPPNLFFMNHLYVIPPYVLVSQVVSSP